MATSSESSQDELPAKTTILCSRSILRPILQPREPTFIVTVGPTFISEDTFRLNWPTPSSVGSVTASQKWPELARIVWANSSRVRRPSRHWDVSPSQLAIDIDSIAQGFWNQILLHPDSPSDF